MNLLIITNNPERAGFRQRIGMYLDTLRAGGIECDVVKLPTGFLARRKLFGHAARYEGIFLQKKTLNIFDAFFLRKYSKKIIYDFDDAIMYSDKNSEIPSRKRLRSFRRTAKLADTIIAGNSYLAGLAEKHNPNTNILPTGLDTKVYKVKKNPERDNKIRLVWIGSKATLMYLAEIRPALEKIGSQFDNVILRIICDEFFDLQNMPVEKCCWTAQTEVRDLITSDIGLSPLPDNKFTRGKCGFKILQYFSAGLPVVASPVGVNVDFVGDMSAGFFASDGSEWIEAIAKLIKNPELRAKMGERGAMIAEKFDVSVIGQKLAALLLQ